MTIRRAARDDASAIADIAVDCWRAAYRGLVPDAYLDGLDRRQWAQRTVESLESGAQETLLAQQDSQVLGFVTLGACRDEDLEPRATGEIWGIYVAPEHWRRGIGRLLCRAADGSLTARQHNQVVAWVFEENRAARRFYEAMGFAADGACKTLERGARVNAVRYRKQL